VLEEDGVAVATYPVRVMDGVVSCRWVIRE